MSGGKYRLPGLLLMAAALLLDQASKWLLLAVVTSPAQPAIEITPFFDLVLVWNYGISFGLFASHRQFLPLTVLSLAIVIILLIWLYKNSSRLVACALGCVMGGAIGNVIDRLRFGAVADFFDFHILGYHWPAFNVADSCIFIGVVLLCWHSMFMDRKSHIGGNRS